MRRTLFTDDHELFRDCVRTFVEKEIAPHHVEWDAAGIVPRELFATAGAAGFLGMAVPEEYGGGGVDDFRYNLVDRRGDPARRASAAPASGSRCTTTSACPTSSSLAHRRAEAALAARHRSGELDHRDRA